MPDLSRLPDMILTGDARGAAAMVREAVDAGNDPAELVDTLLIPTMDEVGRRFECGEVYVPELLVSANAMKAAMAVVEPLLKAAGARSVSKVAIGTVQGDLHDIGKNLVASMLAGGGFEVVDLGVNVKPDQFVDAVRQTGVKIVALSALLTTTMPAMRSTIQALREAGVRGQVKVLIGGAPVTREFAVEIGADGYSPHASGAVDLARKLAAA